METYPLDVFAGATCVMSEKIKLTGYLVPMEMVAERIAHLENENRRLTSEVTRLSTPDFY